MTTKDDNHQLIRGADLCRHFTKRLHCLNLKKKNIKIPKESGLETPFSNRLVYYTCENSTNIMYVQSKPPLKLITLN